MGLGRQECLEAGWGCAGSGVMVSSTYQSEWPQAAQLLSDIFAVCLRGFLEKGAV
jgi:hypothetical protein